MISSHDNIDKQNCLVIDVTYRCNAPCNYCQWSIHNKIHKSDEPDIHVYIPKDTIRALNINRIVFSGGEPLLRQDLLELVRYYDTISSVESIIVITNGILTSYDRVRDLLVAGVTGFTISLDSLSEISNCSSRNYTHKQFERVLDNISNLIQLRESEEFELGVNTVVSRANIFDDSIQELLHFCSINQIDWIKFTPIFDDGYVSQNSPQLLLRSEDSSRIRELGEISKTFSVKSNSISFWSSLASLLEGRKLKGSSCGLTTRQGIAIRGKIKFCFWIDFPTYSDTQRSLTDIQVQEIQSQFDVEKKNCKTGSYCYCLQSLEHRWELE